MTVMTTAERRGYHQICNGSGSMMVIACDQRGGMRSILAATPEEQAKIGNDILGETKADIARYLASHAGCVLVDPVCAVPGLIDNDILPRDTALLIGIDASGWDTSPEGYRISKMVEGVDARRVRALGATGGKIMVYLRMDTPAANVANLETLKRTIEDFAREDFLLVVEFLTYQLEGESREDYQAKIPQLIVEGSRACLELGSKVLKIPYPGSEKACAEVTKVAGDVPWAVLSAGVDHETFLLQVEAAMKNGASGVIAGRSLWKDCIDLDRNISKEKLSTIAVSRLHDIQDIIGRYRNKQRVAA
ncbi:MULTISPECIES: tagatose-bisphosphate aldolase [Rhizobium/Agrobacterium group]|uniref:Aldolase n=2 Tax=Rhizobium/Agrobacterium group TaxID=227290 RepID=B9K0T0_ALLAM|nr:MULTISPECIES: tagatose-bisphosphate aldolase [Rhizobium/Agrobacterium group]ACM38478.1 aldolase [Allorhizobium ampelinum S4]MUO26824.1 tagatose-bisphosphate aldolase [Agrobacterium vitis]MUO40242.1 tagatose-bisphosphate aldolase [Agrobacterium vitis]MUP08703.1 tagatose-bisphosphate aldolase [Agrobacterium vitis]